MSKKVEVKKGVIISNGKTFRKGDALELEDAKAERLVELGVAEYTDEEVEEVAEVVEAEDVEQDDTQADEKSLDEMTVSELKEIAKEKGVEVVGSGAKGAVTKVDLIEALAE